MLRQRLIVSDQRGWCKIEKVVSFIWIYSLEKDVRECLLLSLSRCCSRPCCTWSHWSVLLSCCIEAASVLQLVLREKRMFYVLQLVLLWNMMEKIHSRLLMCVLIKLFKWPISCESEILKFAVHHSSSHEMVLNVFDLAQCLSCLG